MSPYRASLGGIYGSGVYAPQPRQPLVDIGSVVDAVSGGIEAHTRRIAMKAQLDRQSALDTQAQQQQQFERQRQIAADARQKVLDQQNDELHQSRLETEKQTRLASAYEKGLVPTQSVTPSPIDSFVPGLSAAYNATASANGGTTLPTEAMPAHFDYTQGGEYKAKRDEEAQHAADAQALERIRGGFELSKAAMAARKATGTQRTAIPSDGERKAAAQLDGASSAIKTLDQYSSAPPPTSMLGRVPGVGNYSLSPAQQRLEAAGRSLAEEYLRVVSGAAISETEIENFKKQTVPRPGDSTQILQYKAGRRREVFRALQTIAGRASPVGGATAPSAAPVYDGSTDPDYY